MISVCMIVKDEEENLKKCLESIKKLDCEIVVVDTGSTDKSREVAYQYTDKVFEYRWNNDFSDARNFSISKAENDIVLIIDADEIITDTDIRHTKELMQKHKKAVGRINRRNEYKRNDEKYVFNEYVNRIFDRRYFMYEGKIHEQVVSKDGKEYPVYISSIFVDHKGYTDDEIIRKNKIKRNISMLKESIKDKKDPYLYYQLGKSYYMNNNYEKAVESFESAFDCNVDTKYEYVEDLVETYGYSLINLGRYKESVVILNLYEEYKWSADYLFLCGLIYMNNEMFNEAVKQFKKATETKHCSMEGVNDYLSFYNIGVIYECTGNKYEAIKYYTLCDEYEKAVNRIKIIKQSVVHK